MLLTGEAGERRDESFSLLSIVSSHAYLHLQSALEAASSLTPQPSCPKGLGGFSRSPNLLLSHSQPWGDPVLPQLHRRVLVQTGRWICMAHRFIGPSVSHGLSVTASQACRAVPLLWVLGGAAGLTLLCKVIELKLVNHSGAAWLLLCARVQRPGVARSTRRGSLGCSFWRVISPLSCCSQIWVIRFDLNMSENWNSRGSRGTIMQALSQCDSGLVSKALGSLSVSWESWGRFSSSPDTGALVLE